MKGLNVVFQDDALLVINKPVKIAVNDSETQKDKITIQKLVTPIIIKDVFTSDKNDFICRSGIVHRLDSETSGLLIIAKNEKVYELMKDKFKKREVKKEYRAICYGNINNFVSGDEFIIDAPISRNPIARHKFAISENGKEAKTKFKILKLIKANNGEYMYLKCFPETGRTHQIRVHLASMNIPVVGDPIYSGLRRYEKYKAIFNRMYLHAYSLIFTHPVSKRNIKINTDVPVEFESIIHKLEILKT